MPLKYIPYFKDPIKGQALLDNFTRTLKYSGNDKIGYKIKRGMPLYEVKTKEIVHSNPSLANIESKEDTNLLIRGECLSACAYLKEQGIEVDLVYIDPPFASGADYAKKVILRKNPKIAEMLEGENEIEMSEDFKGFEEKMYGDIWDKEKYLNWMYENLMAIKSVMSETASIYVHLDYHIGHYVKILMDEIFGEDNFINEIVWCYNGPGSPGMRQFNRKHDTIFWYTKSSDYCFFDQQIRVKHNEKTLENFKKGLEGSGFISDNYDLDAKGKIPEDWWQFAVAGRFPIDGIKRVNYATEKPFALVERIIQASSMEGMFIADFFGGSGVTSVVANKLGRKFIHCDIGINSIQTTRDRLVADGAQFGVLEIKDGVQLYRNPVQTMDKIKSLIQGLKQDDALDSFWAGSISDSKIGTIPVYIPNLEDSASKLLDTVQMNRIIHQAIPELESSIKKVIIYYIDLADQKEIETFIKNDDSTTVEIELRDLKNILEDVVVGDYAEFHCEPIQEDLFGGYAVTIDRFVSDRVIQKIMEFNQKEFLNSSSKKPYKPIEISEEGMELIEFLSLDCTVSKGEWHSDSEIKIDRDGYVIKDGVKTKNFWDARICSREKPLRIKIRNICGDETEWEIP